MVGQAKRDPATQGSGIGVCDKSLMRTDVRVLGGRVKPGHDELGCCGDSFEGVYLRLPPPKQLLHIRQLKFDVSRAAVVALAA